MASNRMSLRCKGCGAELVIGKSSNFDWYFSSSDEDKGRQLREFLNQHSHCCDDLETDVFDGVVPFNPDFEPFELVYENRDEWGHQKTLQQIDKELHPEKYEQ